MSYTRKNNCIKNVIITHEYPFDMVFIKCLNRLIRCCNVCDNDLLVADKLII
jgi:hypothetical protein